MSVQINREEGLVVLRVGYNTVGLNIEDVTFWSRELLAAREALIEQKARQRLVPGVPAGS